MSTNINNNELTREEKIQADMQNLNNDYVSAKNAEAEGLEGAFAVKKLVVSTSEMKELESVGYSKENFVVSDSMPAIESDEASKLSLKIASIFKSANYLNMSKVDRADWEEILCRADYELETCGDDRDIVNARAAIRQAQKAGNRNK
jgi:hypothetical protein